jgi:phage regulator Rha-like protein
MKTDLVYISKKELVINSKLVSEMLEIKHRDLLRTIKAILEYKKNNVPASALKFPQKFTEGSFSTKMGRTYKMYEMNEQAYMKLAMHLKGYAKAEMVQDSIIEAFSLMKRAVLNQQNSSWLNARKSGKEIRTIETNIIKEFVDYATNQGSKSAFRYYSNVTKMTNKALELLVQTKDGNPLRDLATVSELGYIQMAENIATSMIIQGMKENLPYKYIFKLAKQKVNDFADLVNIKKLS